MAGQVVVRGPGEGTALWMLGGLYEVKASGEETGGTATVMEMTIPEGMGPPPHIHNGAEATYVLEGNARYHIDGQTVDVGPGTFLHFPEGTLETFEPIGQVRLLLFYAPGGVDKFFEEFAEPAVSRELPSPPEEPPDIARLIEVAARHGLEIRAPESV